MSKVTERIYRFGPFRLNRSARLLRREEDAVPLTPKVLDTLIILVENRGRVMGKGELISSIWPDTHVEEGNLTSNISIIRKALGDRPDGRPYIETFPKRGYRFEAEVEVEVEVEEVEEVGSSGANVIVAAHSRSDATSDEMRDQPVGWRLSRPNLVSAGPLLAAICAIAGYQWISAKKPPSIQSLVVLPLKSLGGDGQDDYLADGITDELTASLTKLKRVHMVSPSLAMRFKRSQEDAAAIGRKLGVEAVLEGSLQRTSGRFRARLHLVTARDGFDIWADSFDIDLHDLLRAEQRLAEAVAIGLGGKLTEQERLLVGKKGTIDVTAYEALLLGKAYFGRAGGGNIRREDTEADREVAEQLFKRALQLDPGFADAHGWLAMVLYYQFHDGDSDDRKLQAAIQQANRALEIDPDLIIARRALIHIYHSTGQAEEGIKQAKQALQIDPEDLDAVEGAALAYFRAGMLDRSIFLFQKATSADPSNAATRTELARCYLHAGEYRKGLEALTPLLAQNQGGEWIAMQLYIQLGQYQQAIEIGRRYVKVSPGWELGWIDLGRAYVAAGRPAEARTIWEEGIRRTEGKVAAVENVRTRTWLGILYSELGRTDEAFEQARRALAMSPTDAWVLFMTAQIYSICGAPDRAVEQIERAIANGFLTIQYLDFFLQPSFGLRHLRDYPGLQPVRTAWQRKIEDLKKRY
jgi:DNA-binding winged helix-turn-helix (wHTH) protein/TolB-like protein/Tfp pilus assembly protein PilF